MWTDRRPLYGTVAHGPVQIGCPHPVKTRVDTAGHCGRSTRDTDVPVHRNGFTVTRGSLSQPSRNVAAGPREVFLATRSVAVTGTSAACLTNDSVDDPIARSKRFSFSAALSTTVRWTGDAQSTVPAPFPGQRSRIRSIILSQRHSRSFAFVERLSGQKMSATECRTRTRRRIRTLSPNCFAHQSVCVPWMHNTRPSNRGCMATSDIRIQIWKKEQNLISTNGKRKGVGWRKCIER